LFSQHATRAAQILPVDVCRHFLRCAFIFASRLHFTHCHYFRLFAFFHTLIITLYAPWRRYDATYYAYYWLFRYAPAARAALYMSRRHARKHTHVILRDIYAAAAAARGV